METFGLFSNLPIAVRLPIEFIFTIIIMRGIIGNDITSWLKDKGLIKEAKDSFTYKVLNFAYDTIMNVVNYLKTKIIKTERDATFWIHIVDGHKDSLSVCTKDGCQKLA